MATQHKPPAVSMPPGMDAPVGASGPRRSCPSIWCPACWQSRHCARPGHSDVPGRASRAQQKPHRYGCLAPEAWEGDAEGVFSVRLPPVSAQQPLSHCPTRTPSPAPHLTAAGSRRSSPASCRRLSPAYSHAGPGEWGHSVLHRGSVPHQRCWPHSGLLGVAGLTGQQGQEHAHRGWDRAWRKSSSLPLQPSHM